MFDFFGGGDYIDVFEQFKKEDARKINEYRNRISEINFEIDRQLAKNKEIEKNNDIVLKEIDNLCEEAILLFKEKYNETIKIDNLCEDLYEIDNLCEDLYKPKITLSLNPIKDLENKLIELKSHRKKLFELKLLTRSLYI